jgi:hypothetical protein
MIIVPLDENFTANMKKAVETIEAGFIYKNCKIYPKSGSIQFINGDVSKDTIANIKYNDVPGVSYLNIKPNGVMIGVDNSSIEVKRKFDAKTKGTALFNWTTSNFNWKSIFNNKCFQNSSRLIDEIEEKRKIEEIIKTDKAFNKHMKDNQKDMVEYLMLIVIDSRGLFKPELHNVMLFDKLTMKDLNLNIRFDYGNIVLKYPHLSDIGANKHFRINFTKFINMYLYAVHPNIDETPLRSNEIIPVYSKTKGLRTNVCSFCDKIIYGRIAYIEMFNIVPEAVYQPVCMHCVSLTELDYVKVQNLDFTKEEAIHLCKVKGFDPVNDISYIDNILKLEKTKFRVMNKKLKFKQNEKESGKMREGDIYNVAVWLFDNMEVEEKSFAPFQDMFEFESVDLDKEIAPQSTEPLDRLTGFELQVHSALPKPTGFDVTHPYSLVNGKKEYYATTFVNLMNNIINSKDYIKLINENYENILIAKMHRPHEWRVVP